MDKLTNLFKILSDETRLRLVLALFREDHCVCELTEILNLSQPKISKHLTKLRDLGYVETMRDAQFIYYHLKVKDIVLKNILEDISKHLNHYPILLKDSKKTPTCTIDASRK